jgi:hypothetical protein
MQSRRRSRKHLSLPISATFDLAPPAALLTLVSWPFLSADWLNGIYLHGKQMLHGAQIEVATLLRWPCTEDRRSVPYMPHPRCISYRAETSVGIVIPAPRRLEYKGTFSYFRLCSERIHVSVRLLITPTTPVRYIPVLEALGEGNSCGGVSFLRQTRDGIHCQKLI